jgi:predicted anti-sigma-YlaC factor YlaD
MGPLRHRRLQRLVDPWLDGETTTADARVVEAHVARCRSCLALVQLTVLVKQALGRRRGRRR